MTELLIISLHADPSMPPGIGSYGGGHMYPKELLIGLSGQDFRVALLTRKSYENLPDKESINDKCTIYRLNYGSYGMFDKKELYELRDKSYALAQEIIKKEQIRFQLIHSIYWNSGQLAMRLSEEYKVPYVHSTISNGKQIVMRQAKKIEPHRIDVEQEVFQNAENLFCITQSEKDAIIKKYNIPGSKITVIGRPVQDSYRFPVHNDLGLTRIITHKESQYLHPIYEKKYTVAPNVQWWKKQVFTYAGRIDLNKGLDVILTAWLSLYQIYGNTCPPLWIIGGTPEEINDFHNDIRPNLEDAEKAGKLIWWGTLDAEGISAVYLRSIAVIMHSKYEPGGRVSLEAMTAGVPVIATKCGFAGDMIKDWVNGFLVNYNDADMLAKKMEHFIRQPYLTYSLGYQAKKCAEDISGKWGFLQSHTRIYDKVLSRTTEPEYSPYTENEPIPDYIQVYPFFNFKADDTSVKAFLTNSVGSAIVDFHPLRVKDHCFRWDIMLPTAGYIVCQPYTYINKAPFYYDGTCCKEVCLAADRFLIRRYWADRIPTNDVDFDDTNHLILCNRAIPLDYNLNLLEIITYIQKHCLAVGDDGHNMKEKIAWMIKNGNPVEQIQQYYRSRSQDLYMDTEGNFSYCVESIKLLHAIQTNVLFAQMFGRNVELFIENMAQTWESCTDYILSGFVSGNHSFLSQEGHTVLGNGEFLHLSCPGLDSAVLLLHLSGVSVQLAEWETNINRFPKSERLHIIRWSVILLAKKILLRHNMAQAMEQAGILLAQLNLSIELYNKTGLS